jgi:Transposase DDE domain group 1
MVLSYQASAPSGCKVSRTLASGAARASNIKEGKGAIRWTRLSCRSFAANAVRLQLDALAYNLGNFLRTLATPEPIQDWSLTSLKEKLIKIGAKVVSHGRYVAFQMAEVAIPESCSRKSCS